MVGTIALDSSSFTQGVSKASASMESLKTKQNELVASISSIAKKLVEAGESVALAKKEYQNSVSSVAKYKLEMEKAAAALDSSKARLAENRKSLEEQKAALAESKKAAADAKIKYDALKEALGENAAATKQAKTEYGTAKQAVDENRRAVEWLNAEYRSINEVVKNNRKALGEAKKEYNESAAASEKLKNSLSALENECESNNRKLADNKKALEDVKREMQSKEWDNFKGKLSALGSAAASFGKAVAEGVEICGKAVVAGVGAATIAIAGLTGKALLMGGELEQNLGGSEAVFKNFADTVQTLGSSAFETLGLSQSDFLAAANKMGALMQGAGLSIEQSMSLATEAMQRAADVASIMGISTADAMEAVTGAAKGNFTMMDNLGVAMNATSIEAYALSKGIKTAYNDMENAQKVILAMEMFLENTAYAAGNYAKENETLAGSLSTARAAMSDFMSGSGDVESAVDAFSNFADVAAKNLDELVPRLTDGFVKIVDELAPRIPAILDTLMPTIVDGAISLVTNFANAIQDNLSPVVSAIARRIPTVLDNLLPPVVDGAVALVSEFVKVILDNLPTIASAGRKIVSSLLSGIGDIAPFLTPVTGAMKLLINNIELVVSVMVPFVAAFAALKTVAFVQQQIIAVGSAMKALQASTAAASVILKTSTAVQAAFAAAATGSATAVAVQKAARAAGMTIDAAGNLITAAGTKATAAQTIAVLASSGALSTKSVIVGVLTGKIGLVTAAQWLWNAAMAANPIGTIIALVTGLAAAITVAVTAIVFWIKKDSAAVKELKENTEELKESNESLIRSIENLKAAHADKLNSIEAEAIASEKLANEVFHLAEAENKSVADKERLATMVDALNRSMDGLNLQYDAETDSLSKNRGEIEKMIEARKEQARAIAAQELMVETAKKQLDVEMQLKNILEQRKNIEEKLKNKEISEGEYRKAINAIAEEYVNLSNESTKLGMALDDITGAIGDAGVAANNAVAGVENLEDGVENLGNTAENAAEKQKAALESLSQKYADYANAATDMFSRITDESDLSVQEMLENLYENQRIVGDWANNLAELADRGINEGILAQLRNMGTEGAGYVATLVAASEEQIADLNTLFKHGGETSTNALATAWDVDTSVAGAAADLAKSASDPIVTELSGKKFHSVGADVAVGLANGITENAHVAVDAARGMANAVTDATESAVEVNSPSKVFSRIGEALSMGLANGIKSAASAAVDAAKNMAFSVSSVVDGIAQKVANTAKNILQNLKTLMSGQTAAPPEKTWEELGKLYGNSSSNSNSSSGSSSSRSSSSGSKSSSSSYNPQKEAENAQKEAQKEAEKVQKDKENAEKQAFNDAKKHIDYRKKMGWLSADAEISELKNLRDAYKDNADYRMQLDVEIYEAEKKLVDAREKETKDAYSKSKKSMEYLKKLGLLAIDDEIAKLEELSAEYQNNEDIRMELDVALHEARKRQQEEELKGVQDVFNKKKKSIETGRKLLALSFEDEIAMLEQLAVEYSDNEELRIDAENAVLDAKRRQLDHSKKWIENGKKMNLLSQREIIEGWERVTKRYVEGTELRAEADQALYDAKKELMDKQAQYVEKIENAEKSYYDAVESSAKSMFNSLGLFNELTICAVYKQFTLTGLTGTVMLDSRTMTVYSDSMQSMAHLHSGGFIRIPPGGAWVEFTGGTVAVQYWEMWR